MFKYVVSTNQAQTSCSTSNQSGVEKVTMSAITLPSSLQRPHRSISLLIQLLLLCSFTVVPLSGFSAMRLYSSQQALNPQNIIPVRSVCRSAGVTTLRVEPDGETLDERHPATTECKRALTFTHDKIADVRVAQGNLPAALTAFEKGLAIAEALAARDSANTMWQRDLFVSHIKIADASRKRLGRSFGVKLWPTLVFLRDGRIIDQTRTPPGPESLLTPAPQR